MEGTRLEFTPVLLEPLARETAAGPGFELKSWIKGFLPHVQVLKPLALRDEIGADLDQARKAFRVTSSSR